MWVSAQPPVLCFPQSRPEARGCFSLIPLSARIRAHLPSPAKGRKVHGPLGVPRWAVRAGRRELKAFLSAVPISNPFFPPQGLPGELGQWEQGGTTPWVCSRGLGPAWEWGQGGGEASPHTGASCAPGPLSPASQGSCVSSGVQPPSTAPSFKGLPVICHNWGHRDQLPSRPCF